MEEQSEPGDMVREAVTDSRRKKKSVKQPDVFGGVVQYGWSK